MNQIKISERINHLREDGEVPANNAGGGQIAGIGVNNPNLPNQAEPGVNLKAHKKKQRQKNMVNYPQFGLNAIFNSIRNVKTTVNLDK